MCLFFVYMLKNGISLNFSFLSWLALECLNINFLPLRQNEAEMEFKKVIWQGSDLLLLFV